MIKKIIMTDPPKSCDDCELQGHAHYCNILNINVHGENFDYKNERHPACPICKEIKIKLDYGNGPIWKDHTNPVTGELDTGVPCVDEDKALQVLNDEAQRMYNSLYSFDAENACQFDEESFIKFKKPLLSIVQTIIMRLEMINDGSFSITDEASDELRSLREVRRLRRMRNERPFI